MNEEVIEVESWKQEILSAIGDSYEHWVELIEELDLPGFEDCPLCRYSKRMRGISQHLRTTGMCPICPVVIYIGTECVVDEDFEAYTDLVQSSYSSNGYDDEIRELGAVVLDRIVSLWLTVWDSGRMITYWDNLEEVSEANA